MTISLRKGANEVTWDRSRAQKVADICANIKWSICTCSHSLAEKYLIIIKMIKIYNFLHSQTDREQINSPEVHQWLKR